MALLRRFLLHLIALRLRKRFPGVAEMRPAELAARLGHPPLPVLLDVRAVEEFRVSHLPGARHIDPGLTPLNDIPRHAEIVVYCSVGYRSARFSARMQGEGYAHVSNLRGGLFAWASTDRMLTDGRRPVQRVHPFSRAWGRLLDPARRAPQHN